MLGELARLSERVYEIFEFLVGSLARFPLPLTLLNLDVDRLLLGDDVGLHPVNQVLDVILTLRRVKVQSLFQEAINTFVLLSKHAITLLKVHECGRKLFLFHLSALNVQTAANFDLLECLLSSIHAEGALLPCHGNLIMALHLHL